MSHPRRLRAPSVFVGSILDLGTSYHGPEASLFPQAESTVTQWGGHNRQCGFWETLCTPSLTQDRGGTAALCVQSPVLFWEGRQTLGSSYVAEQEKGAGFCPQPRGHRGATPLLPDAD